MTHWPRLPGASSSPHRSALLAELRRACAEMQIAVSDRRWVKIVWLLRIAAASVGRSQVSLWDLLLLPWCTAPDTERQALVADWLAARLGVREALRTAHVQRRACHVFAFGGPDEVIDMELAYDAVGIERLTQFLGQAFRGGTDICGPLDQALAKLECAAWQQADLLIASDGEFGATPEMAQRLAVAKRELGLRVQGVLIGDRETVGFLEIADAIFPVRDWRKLGGESVESPVHSHRLTALYFPGALRSEENRAAIVSPESAASVVRGIKS